MKISAKIAKSQQVASIFDAAVALAKSCRCAGNMDMGGERKRVYYWQHSEFIIELLEAHPLVEKAYVETSFLKVRHEGQLVFEVRFDEEGMQQQKMLKLPVGDNSLTPDWLSQLQCHCRRMRSRLHTGN